MFSDCNYSFRKHPYWISWLFNTQELYVTPISLEITATPSSLRVLLRSQPIIWQTMAQPNLHTDGVNPNPNSKAQKFIITRETIICTVSLGMECQKFCTLRVVCVSHWQKELRTVAIHHWLPTFASHSLTVQLLPVLLMRMVAENEDVENWNGCQEDSHS
jgi:hypothetical protein